MGWRMVDIMKLYTEWSDFTEALAAELDRLDRNEINFSMIYEFLERHKELIGSELLLNYICDIVSEIDGFHKSYMELLTILRSSPSRDDLAKYIISPN